MFLVNRALESFLDVSGDGANLHFAENDTLDHFYFDIVQQNWSNYSREVLDYALDIAEEVPENARRQPPNDEGHSTKTSTLASCLDGVQREE